MATDKGFGVAEKDGRSWLVSPGGKPFLSYGVCCIDQGTKPDKRNPLNPTYCASDHYRSSQDWAKATQKRLVGWGFNTVGAWSEHSLLRSPSLYQTPVLHLSATGIPWVDPWDKDTIEAANKQANEMIGGWRSDPNVIGYFSDNELGWWIGAIFEWAFKYKPNSAGRQVFINELRGQYATWEIVNEDFYAIDASSFEDLLLKGRLYVRPGKQGMKFVRRWLGCVASQYYSVTREAIKKADPKALFLGDRYISNYYPEVASASSRYVDVVSTNLNADWNSGELTPFYLESLHRLTNKTILITELYAAAMENQSGNMNDSSGFPTVRTQKDRVRCFSKQVESLLGKPYVVGLHWFQYYDEGMHGRDDGENYNMGLVDISNKPYKLLAERCKKVFASPPPAASKKPAFALPYLNPYDANDLMNWDTNSAALPISERDARGDMFASWNESGIYIGLYWYEDRFFEALYENGVIPVEEQAAAELKINDLKVSVKLDGVSKSDPSTGYVLRYSPGNGSSGNTRNTLILRISAKDLGLKQMHAGQPVSISGTLSTRGRAYTMQWQASAPTGKPAKTN